jgi:hypothetical protein
MKAALIVILVLVIGLLFGGLEYFRANQARDAYRTEVERLLQGGFDKPDEELEGDIRRVGTEVYGIDEGTLQIAISREAPGENDLIEGLTSGSRLPSRSLQLTAEVSYTGQVFLFRPSFSFLARAVRHKREHPHKSLIEEVLPGRNR